MENYIGDMLSAFLDNRKGANVPVPEAIDAPAAAVEDAVEAAFVVTCDCEKNTNGHCPVYNIETKEQEERCALRKSKIALPFVLQGKDRSKTRGAGGKK